MIEVLKEFLLFGAIEFFVLVYFCNGIGGLKLVKWWHFILVSPFVLFCAFINFPFAKQIGMAIILITYLIILYKKFEVIFIKIIAFSFMYLLVFEVFFSIVYSTIFKIDLMNISDIYKFLLFIPIRLIQIFIILNAWRIKQWGSCGSMRLKKKQMKK